MQFEDIFEIQQQKFRVIGLDFCLLLEHYRFQVEFQILVILLLLKIANDFVRLYKIDVHSTEKTHSDFRLLLQNPHQLLVDFALVFGLGE